MEILIRGRRLWHNIMTMKYFILLFLFVLCKVTPLFPVNFNADSLEGKLLQMKLPERIDAWNKLSQYYSGLDIPRSLAFAKQALESSRSSNDPKRTAQSLINIGNVFYNYKDYGKSIKYYDTSLILAKNSNDLKGIVAAYTNLGAAYEGKSKFEKSLELYMEALTINLTIKDSTGIGKSYNNIGNIYYYLDQPQKALDHYQKALSIFKNLHDLENMNAMVNNIGMIYSVMGKPELSLKAFREFLTYCKSINDKVGQAMALNNIGSLYYESNNYQQALGYFLQSLRISEELGSIDPVTLNFTGNTYVFLGEYNKALGYFFRAVTISRENHLYETLRAAYEAIHNTYGRMGNYRDAYKFLKLYQSVNDSLSTQLHSKQVVEMQTKYETAKKESEIEILKDKARLQTLELNRQKVISNIFVIGCIVLAMLVSLVVYSLQLKIKSNRQLKIQRDIADRANKAKSVFLSNMSHEIRTPMNGIMGMAEVLKASGLDAKQTEYSDVIINSSDKLLSVINNVLDFSLMESGTLVLENRPFNLQEMFHDLVDHYTVKAEDKGLLMEAFFDARISSLVNGDSLRLRQILMNLCDNAIKFTEKGEVSMMAELVSRENATQWVKILIQDSGIGISADDLTKLFLPFSQVDPSVTRRYTGAGLGLVISSRLVEIMGGKIEVTSNPGNGSAFFFTLPLTFDSTTSEEPSVVLNLSNKKVLVIDESTSGRIILKKYLENWSCKVQEAETGEEGLRLLKAFQPLHEKIDLVLLDHQNIRMDVFEFASRFKAQGNDAQVKLMLVTSRPDLVTQKQLEDHEFAGYISKPVHPGQLAGKMVQIFPDLAQDAPKVDIEEEWWVKMDHPLQILLVEDNEVNQRVMVLMLQKFHPVIEVAINGKIALDMIRDGDFDLVLMDVQMPDMDGLEATRIIRQWERDTSRTKSLLIVALTADATAENRDKCLNAGMNGYLVKPFSMDAFIKLMNTLTPSI